MKQATFDWRGLETAAVNHMIAAVRQVRDMHPQPEPGWRRHGRLFADMQRMFWKSWRISFSARLHRLEQNEQESSAVFAPSP